jgi:flagellar motor switch protein FliN/FliY
MSPPSDQPNADAGSGSGHSESLFAKIEAQAEAARAQDERLGSGRNLESILRIPVLMQVVLGSATMPVSSLMKLGRGAIVPLDHRVGEPVDVVVNGRVIARGEVVVVEDDNSRFGVSLTEIVGPAAAESNG